MGWAATKEFALDPQLKSIVRTTEMPGKEGQKAKFLRTSFGIQVGRIKVSNNLLNSLNRAIPIVY